MWSRNSGCSRFLRFMFSGRYTYLQDVDGQKSPLNLLLPPRVKLALKGLRQHYLVTQAELLDRLLAEAQGQVLSGMTAEEQTRFHDAVTV